MTRDTVICLISVWLSLIKAVPVSDTGAVRDRNNDMVLKGK